MVFQKTLDYGFVGYQAPQIPRATRSARKRGSFRKQIGDNPMSAFDLLATVAGNLLLEKESSPSSSNTLVKKELESVDTPLKVEDILNVNLEKVSQAHISLKNFSHFHNEDNSGIASVVTPSECSEKVDDLEYTKKGILLGNFAAKVETSHDYVLDDENKEHVKLEGPKTENASISNAGDMYSSDIMLESNVKLPFCDKHITSDSLPVGGRDDVKFVIASVVTSSECSEKIDGLENAEKGILLGNFAAKVEKSHDDVLDDENKEHVKLEAPKTENTSISSAGDMYSSDIMLESNVKLQLCDKHITSDSLPVGDRDDVKLVIRDDDENSSQCTKLGTGNKAFRPLPRVGDLRIRKLLASKYWKVTSKSKEVPSYMTDSEMKSAYECRKICYKRYRSQRDYPFKKRRLYRCSSASNSDGGFNGDNVVSLPRNGFSFDDSGSGAKVKGGSGISARVVGQTTPLQTRDSLVKLRIKSFKVPELFIEIPENATVGNLKRTVLEAVTAALGGGLRVGVLLQGKKIRDDDRTLQQTGISHDDMLEALGFSLESNSSQVPSALQHEDGPSLLPCDSPKQIKRYPTSPREACRGIQPKTITVLSETPLLNLGNFIDSDHDSTPSPPDMDSKALVAAPSMNAEALNMVPLKKSKQSNSSQRRIRRPFSVTEVEALVQAVENLGTGRWRDVKLKAFDNAKHRTYVDLKDKWKTLVHTARISPQQRRGEQVPQELLDRVLSAHAYWSQQQVKQQLKHHSETCLLF